MLLLPRVDASLNSYPNDVGVLTFFLYQYPNLPCQGDHGSIVQGVNVF